MNSISIPYIFNLSDKGSVHIYGRDPELFIIKKSACNRGANKVKLYLSEDLSDGVYDIVLLLVSKDNEKVKNYHKTRIQIMGKKVEEINKISLSKYTYSASRKEQDNKSVYSYTVKVNQSLVGCDGDLEITGVNLPNTFNIDYDLLGVEEGESSNEIKLKVNITSNKLYNDDANAVLCFKCCNDKRYGFFKLKSNSEDGE